MECKGITLSGKKKKSPLQKFPYYMILLISHSWNDKIAEMETK